MVNSFVSRPIMTTLLHHYKYRLFANTANTHTYCINAYNYSHTAQKNNNTGTPAEDIYTTKPFFGERQHSLCTSKPLGMQNKSPSAEEVHWITANRMR